MAAPDRTHPPDHSHRIPSPRAKLPLSGTSYRRWDLGFGIWGFPARRRRGSHAFGCGRAALGGFTLLELILVTVLIGLAVPGILVLFETTSRASYTTQQVAVATNLAGERLEQVTADKFSAARGYAWIIVAGRYPVEAPVAGFVGYDRTTTVAEVNPSDLQTASPGSGYARVTVVISFNGGADTVQVETLLTNHP